MPDDIGTAPEIIDRLIAHPLVGSGALVPLLQDYFASPPVPIYAVMLQERHRLPKIRACIDFWADWLAQIAGAQSSPPR